MSIIGRIEEIKILNDKLASGKSEFVALYGRRRVGKTYLVRNVFSSKITFQMTGLAHVKLPEQLKNFNKELQSQHPHPEWKAAEDWIDAFQQLRWIIERSRLKKKIIFIDELPWFDTAHSRFIQALEHFWNSWASGRKDILLVVCGSAASWMINVLINNTGGLHNRVTQRIKIEPFTLKECEAYLQDKNISLEHYQIIELYMALGGIPFYWEAVQKGLSAKQNINRLCFEPNSLLKDEFKNLFKSLFVKAERHEVIINTLAKKSKGLTRKEIMQESKITNGGGLTRLLIELEESGFIRRYVPFGGQTRNSLYQLSDFFSLFHLKFMEGMVKFDKNHWVKMIENPKYKAWSGYAFEQVCLTHNEQIKSALGISGMGTETSAWKSTLSKDGAQIDLVIDRRDGVINLCEMKFSVEQFIIDKKYDAVLRNKIGTFRSETHTKKTLFITMVTTYGLLPNQYSGNVQNDLKMEVLFAS